MIDLENFFFSTQLWKTLWGKLKTCERAPGCANPCVSSLSKKETPLFPGERDRPAVCRKPVPPFGCKKQKLKFSSTFFKRVRHAGGMQIAPTEPAGETWWGAGGAVRQWRTNKAPTEAAAETQRPNASFSSQNSGGGAKTIQ